MVYVKKREKNYTSSPMFQTLIFNLIFHNSDGKRMKMIVAIHINNVFFIDINSDINFKEIFEQVTRFFLNN